MQKITPFIWFDSCAEQAVDFYVSVFADALKDSVMAGPDGNALLVNFTLFGQKYMAINGGPMYQLTEAFSLMIHCENQAEVDHYWAKLSEGGSEQMCGWLKDRFGLSWQVIPNRLGELMGDPDLVKAGRVMHAMLQMQKIDIATLEAAHAG